MPLLGLLRRPALWLCRPVLQSSAGVILERPTLLQPSQVVTTAAAAATDAAAAADVT